MLYCHLKLCAILRSTSYMAPSSGLVGLQMDLGCCALRIRHDKD